MLTKISQQTWDQLVTEALAIVGAVITLTNTAGLTHLGNDTIQSIIQLLTLLAAFASSILYSANSTPNRQVAQIEALAYHHGYDRAMAREDKGGI